MGVWGWMGSDMGRDRGWDERWWGGIRDGMGRGRIRGGM